MTTEQPWTGWADAWRAEPSPVAPDLADIATRVRREQTLEAVRLWVEVVGCAAAVLFCLWVIATADPPGVVVGIAGLAFTLFGLVVSLGRERAPNALASQTVAAALDWEIARAVSGVRSAAGGLLVAVAALLFLLLCALVFRQQGLMAPGSLAVWSVGAALLYTLGSGSLGIWMFRRRSDRVRRLRALRATLVEEAKA